jgi:uncharacterized protein
MIYLDTNVIVSLLAEDSTSAAAEQWWNAQSAPLAVSPWVTAEFYSHIGLRYRKHEITSKQASTYVEKFDEMVASNLTLLKSTDTTLLRAAAWLRAADCSMQTADALHLAIALENEAAAISTFDARFAKCVEKLRISGLKVIALPAVGARHQLKQNRAAYNVTEQDIAKAVKWARKRKTAERENALRLTVR